jgi:phage baseplate assembly protein W
MADLYLSWGGDLVVAPAGDLLLADGDGLGVQRVLRRLLTNPGDVVFHAEYGAGLASFVGQPAAPQRLAALIAAQAVQETAVARTPAPQVSVDSTADGTLTAVLQYTSSATGAGQQLTVQPGT